MKTLSLVNGDIALDSTGRLAVVTGAEALRQKLETRLRLYRGEWFLDTSSGVPYLQRILGRGSERSPNDLSSGSLNQIFDAECLKESEVRSIVRSESVFDTAKRSFSYTAELDTIYGTVPLEVTDGSY